LIFRIAGGYSFFQYELFFYQYKFHHIGGYMEELELTPWISVNELLSDSTREHIIQAALSQIDNCPLELLELSKRVFRKNIKIDGFRSFARAPEYIKKQAVANKFQHNPIVYNVVIALWATSGDPVFQQYEKTLRSSSLPVGNSWDWKIAINGYHQPETNAELSNLTKIFYEDKNQLEKELSILAELWFSTGVIDWEEEEVEELEKIDKPISSIMESCSDDKEYDKDPPQLLLTLSNIKGNLESCHGILKVELINLNNAFETWEFDKFTRSLDKLIEGKDLWIQLSHQEETVRESLRKQLLYEFSKREDINEHVLIEQLRDGGDINDEYSNLDKAVNILQSYDTKKLEYLNIVQKKQAKLSEQISALRAWDNSEIEEVHDLLLTDDLVDASIEEIRVRIDNLDNQTNLIANKLQTFRTRTIKNIQHRITEIQQVVRKPKDITINNQPLSSFNMESLIELDDPNLIKLDNEVEKEHTDILARSHPGKAKEAAKELFDNGWNEKHFKDLIEGLATETRGAEVLLAQLAAGKNGHLTNIEITYSSEVVDSLLSGLDIFAGSDSPFDFVGSVFPILIEGWKVLSPKKKAELCILAVKANCQASYRFPDGFLWTVSDKWPLPDEMPFWETVWNGLIYNNPPIIFSDELEKKSKDNLEKAKKSVEIALKKQGGHYVRLDSFQSNRHRIMILKHFMPEAEEIRDSFNNFETMLAQSHPAGIKKILNKLSNYISEKENEFSGYELEKKYDKGISAEEINDQDPFHKRVALTHMYSCSEKIFDFGYALTEYWKVVDSRQDSIKFEQLLDELEALDRPSTLTAVLEESSMNFMNSNLPVWDDKVTNSVIEKYVLCRLLKERAFAMRMPLTIGYLINDGFKWDQFFHRILNDIANPLKPEEAAEYLLDQDALNQAALLVDLLDMEKQKLVVSIEKDKLIRDLKRELRKLDTSGLDIPEDFEEILQRDQDLGRWGYLENLLSDYIELSRLTTQEAQRNIDEEIKELLQEIRLLEDDLFEIRDSIPEEAFNSIMEAFKTIRVAPRDPDLPVIGKELIAYVKFRYEHKSWSENEVKEKIGNFITKALKKEIDDKTALSIEEIYYAFKDGRYSDLGLVSNQFETSRERTRKNILDLWMRLAEIKKIFTNDLNSMVVEDIQQLFSLFARMINMKHFISLAGKSLDSTDKLVHQYWELIYPKTSELDIPCVFVALPGSTTISEIRRFDDFLAERYFEESYFVFIFAPGCSSEILGKIKGRSGGEKFVLIDDEIIKKLVLAEVHGKTPADILRPLMMRSVEESATVFVYKGSTNEYTGIFVGREPLINEMVTSSENYTLYGGRYIGKSSVLNAIKRRLENLKTEALYITLEGESDYDNAHILWRLAEKIGIVYLLKEDNDFKNALVKHMELHSEKNLVLLIDEIDYYLKENKEQFTVLEPLRACSEIFGSRFRVIISGATKLYSFLKERGQSDTWRRMFKPLEPLGNLKTHDAEKIVEEGFISILGWHFEDDVIPRLIIEHTGGHPAFVQNFCSKLLNFVRDQNRRIIKVDDVEYVFKDTGPNSFMEFVRNILDLNLDDPAKYLLLMMPYMNEDIEMSGFTRDQLVKTTYVSDITIPESEIERILDNLIVMSVVKAKTKDIFEFTVPDYPNILRNLVTQKNIGELESSVKALYQE
jgi:hypothetical protein